jgi:hypothetical protein
MADREKRLADGGGEEALRGSSGRILDQSYYMLCIIWWSGLSGESEAIVG